MAIGPGSTGGQVADKRHDHRGPMSVGSGEPGARDYDRRGTETTAFPSGRESPA